VLYDVSTLYFGTDTGDGFREPGFSKERVRREALVDRVEVKDLHGGSVAAGLRSSGQPARGGAGVGGMRP
jgi:hypothetical protein